MYASSTPPSTPRKRSRTASTSRSSTSVPKEVKQYVNAVLKRNIEIKEKSYVDNFTQTNNTGLSLIYPGQGVANGLRIGDEIRLQELRVRGIMGNLFADNTPHFMRMVVYMSRSTGLLPFTDMFYGLTSTQVPAILNPNYLKILVDKTYKFDGAQAIIQNFDIRVSLRNKKITFDENTVSPEQETIHIHFFQCDKFATPVNNGVCVNYDVILRYRDA